MAKKSVKKKNNLDADAKTQAKAILATYKDLESFVIEKLSEEEFSEFQELSADMSTKKKMFCFFYAKWGNAAEAARSAGYSVKSARKTGSRLLTNEDIRKFQCFLNAIFESDLIADIAEIMKSYTRIIRREEKEIVPITIKEHKSWFDKNGKKKTSDTERIEMVEVPAKLSDVNHAADSMMKRYGAFKESISINGNLGVSPENSVIATLATSMTLDDMAVSLKSATTKMGLEAENGTE